MNSKNNYSLFMFFFLLIGFLWFYSRYRIHIEPFDEMDGGSSGNNYKDKSNKKNKQSRNKKENISTTATCILLGDSILNNKQYVPPGKSVYDIINNDIPTVMYARDGDTVSDVYNQLTLIPTEQNVDGVSILLSIGGNDFLGGRPFPLVSKKYSELLKQIKHKMSNCKLYVLNLYYPPTMTFFYNTIKKWNHYLDSLLLEGSVDGLVDISSMRDAEYFTQKIEPSVTGGQHIAELCVNALQ
jgi:hypothetical protein